MDLYVQHAHLLNFTKAVMTSCGKVPNLLVNFEEIFNFKNILILHAKALQKDLN